MCFYNTSLSDRAGPGWVHDKVMMSTKPKQRTVANDVRLLLYILLFYNLLYKTVIAFQRKIILSKLNYEMKFLTGTHFTKQYGGRCLILMSLKWLRLIRTFQQALYHSSPPWQSVLIFHWLAQQLTKCAITK